MSEENVVVEEEKKVEKKEDFLFSNKQGVFESEVFLRLNEKGIWDALTEGEFVLLPEEEKEDFEKYEVEFIRPWWRLSVQVDNLSSDVNDIGIKINNVSKSVDNIIKYYMKKTSFFELEFEKDLDGFEKISDKRWLELTGRNGLSPQIIACLYRAYKEVSDI